MVTATSHSLVVAVDSDAGQVFIGGRSRSFGVDVVYGGLSAQPYVGDGRAEIAVVIDALPDEVRRAWHTGRAAKIIEVPDNAGSVMDGVVVFDGKIESQPVESGGEWLLRLSHWLESVVALPGGDPVDMETWPRAAPDAVGKIAPFIVGTVEDCPVLAVDEPVSTKLSESAFPGQVTLSVDKTEKFSDFGAVWVGDECIFYNGVSGGQFVSLSVSGAHPDGSPVVQAGPATYLLAENRVGVLRLSAGGQEISGYSASESTVTFDRRPLVNAVGEAMNIMVQFDQVAVGAWGVSYDVSYESGKAIKAPYGAKSLVTTTQPSAGTPTIGAEAKKGQIDINATLTSVVEDYVETAQGLSTAYDTCNYTWTCQASVNGGISIPSGASVTLSCPEIQPAMTVGGKEIKSNKLTVTSNGNVKVGGTYSLRVTFSHPQMVMGAGASEAMANYRAIARTVREILRVGRSFNDIASAARASPYRGFGVTARLRSNNPVGYLASLAVPPISASWKLKSDGTPLPAQAPVTKTNASRETESVPTLTDLHQIITPPSSVVSGGYAMSVDVLGQLRNDITNPAPVYSASLGGVTFSLPKEGGTVIVNVPVTSGTPIELIHTVVHKSSSNDMRAVVNAMFEEGVETASDLEIASAMALICPQITKVSVSWSNATISNPALNPVNAIRAVTGNVTQSATGMDASIATTGKGMIRFARPNADRIVSGTYTVSYSIDRGAYAGPMGIKIGGDWVFYAEDEVPAYAWNPATITMDDDTDLLPVEVVGGEGQVSVTITAASRTVLTGNLDGGKYATLKHPSNINWKAVQADVVPRLGKLQKARLAVEWFMGGTKGAANPDVQVRFGGVLRGSLRLEAPAGSTTSKTITVDVTSQGAASLTPSNISTVVSGGTASLSHQTQAFTTTITPNAYMRQYSSSPVVFQSYAGGLNFIGWDSSMGNIKASVYIQAATSGEASGQITEFCEFLNASKSNISAVSGPYYEEIIPGEMYARVVYFSQAVAYVRFRSLSASTFMKIANVRFDWTGKVTQNAVSQSNTPASGYTSIPNGTLNHSGTAVAVNNGSFTITVPDSPRTVVTEFELPDVTDWADLTGKVCEISYTSGTSTLDVHLVQVQIAVDYTEENQTVVGGDLPLLADLQGFSDNPAEVMRYLGELQGERFSLPHLYRLRDWCAAHVYRYARRIAEPTDALTLLTYAAEQAMVQLARLPDGRLAPVRWFDLAGDALDIKEADCMAEPVIGWADRIENRILLNYREGPGGATRSLAAHAGNNRYCRRGLAAIKRENKVSLDAFWIRDDDTAAMLLADYARRYAMPRRVIQIDLPFTLSEQAVEGALICFYPHGADLDGGILARITRASLDAGWPSIEAEEIIF